MLWKLFGSNEKLARALAQPTRTQDLSPSLRFAANDDQNRPNPGMPNAAGLYLEGWNEQDEARLLSDDPWDGALRG
jgi:hypothetical protein